MYKSLLVCLCFLACRKAAVNESNPATVKLSECADVQRESSTLRVCLDSLYDSRCPANVECIWAGVAIVKLNVTGNRVHSFKMSTINSRFFPPADTVIENHHFQLRNVLPYPGSGSTLSPRIELNVE